MTAGRGIFAASVRTWRVTDATCWGSLSLKPIRKSRLGTPSSRRPGILRAHSSMQLGEQDATGRVAIQCLVDDQHLVAEAVDLVPFGPCALAQVVHRQQV